MQVRFFLNKSFANASVFCECLCTLGWTPLHDASSKGLLAIVEVLLEFNASPNVPGGEENVTPLHDAASGGFSAIVRKLIEYGAKKDAIDARGNTPG